jgi:hypothetical protein
MTIEVRQLQIKSSVLQDDGMETKGSDRRYDLEELKEDILLECRQMLMEILRQKQER